VRPSICWGNAAESVTSLIEAGELATLALVILGYLETCNPDDLWGRTIVEWPPAQDDEEDKPSAARMQAPPAVVFTTTPTVITTTTTTTYV